MDILLSIKSIIAVLPTSLVLFFFNFSGIFFTWEWLWPGIRGKSFPASRLWSFGKRALRLWPSNWPCSDPGREHQHTGAAMYWKHSGSSPLTHFEHGLQGRLENVWPGKKKRKKDDWLESCPQTDRFQSHTVTRWWSPADRLVIFTVCGQCFYIYSRLKLITCGTYQSVYHFCSIISWSNCLLVCYTKCDKKDVPGQDFKFSDCCVVMNENCFYPGVLR